MTQNTGKKATSNQASQQGYFNSHGRLICRYNNNNGQLQEFVIVNCTATIDQVINVGEHRYYRVKGRGERSGKYEFEIDAEDFESPTKLSRKLGPQIPLDPISANQSKHLPAAIKAVSKNPTSIKRYSCLGWHNGKFIIPGRNLLGIEVEEIDDLPYEFPSNADKQAALTSFEKLITSLGPDVTTSVICFAFVPPLAKHMGWRHKRAALHMAGRTGSLKTSVATAASAIYGSRFLTEERFIKWGYGGTMNAMMHMAAYANDLPILLDNFKPNVGGGDRAYVSIVHSLVEGGEKKRLNRNSELKESQDIFTWPMFTGEGVPSIDAATQARILPIFFPWANGALNKDLEHAQENADNLPAIGQIWIEWLETNNDEIQNVKACFGEKRKEWSSYLQKNHPQAQNKLRIAQNLAILESTWECVCLHPDMGEIARKYKDNLKNGLKHIAGNLAIGTDESMEAQRLITGLRELLATGKVYLCPKDQNYTNPWNISPSGRQEMIGYFDNDFCYLLPALTLQACRKHLGEDLSNANQTAISKQLEGLNLLVASDKDRLVKSLRTNDGLKRTWMLKMETLRPQ